MDQFRLWAEIILLSQIEETSTLLTFIHAYTMESYRSSKVKVKYSSFPVNQTGLCEIGHSVKSSHQVTPGLVCRIGISRDLRDSA